jgi:Holliday junction resolvase YEN1
LQLAHAHFGPRLLRGIQDNDNPSFLNDWRQDLRFELLTNASHHLSSRHPKLAGSIPDGFPDLKVLDLYVNPVVHESDLAAGPPLSFTCNELKAMQFAAFAAVTFHWGRTAQGVFKRYEDVLFPAMALRQLIQGAVAIDEGCSVAGSSCCPMIGAIVRERKAAGTCFLSEVRVMLAIPSQLIRQICGCLPGPPLTEAVITQIEEDCARYRAWLPREMMEVVRPDLIAVYEHSTISKKQSGRWFIFILCFLEGCSTHHSIQAPSDDGSQTANRAFAFRAHGLFIKSSWLVSHHQIILVMFLILLTGTGPRPGQIVYDISKSSDSEDNSGET